MEISNYHKRTSRRWIWFLLFLGIILSVMYDVMITTINFSLVVIMRVGLQEECLVKYIPTLVLVLLNLLIHLSGLLAVRNEEVTYKRSPGLMMSVLVAVWSVGVIGHHQYWSTWMKPQLVANVIVDLAVCLYLGISTYELVEREAWRNEIDHLRHLSYRYKGA